MAISAAWSRDHRATVQRAVAVHTQPDGHSQPDQLHADHDLAASREFTGMGCSAYSVAGLAMVAT